MHNVICAPWRTHGKPNVFAQYAVYAKIRPFSNRRYVGLTKVGTNQRKRLHIVQLHVALSSNSLDKCHSVMLRNGLAKFFLGPVGDLDARNYETHHLRTADVRLMRLLRVSLNTLNQHARNLAPRVVMH